MAQEQSPGSSARRCVSLVHHPMFAPCRCLSVRSPKPPSIGSYFPIHVHTGESPESIIPISETLKLKQQMAQLEKTKAKLVRIDIFVPVYTPNLCIF